MKTKHTKNWFASPMDDTSKDWGVYFNEDFSDTDSETGDHIQYAGMTTTIIADNLTEQQAKLIASAHGLLEALKYAKSKLLLDFDASDKLLEPICQAIKKSI